MSIERITAALDDDHNSQAAYTGRIIQKQDFTIQDSDGNTIHVEKDVIITWDTIKKVLSLVRDRAQI